MHASDTFDILPNENTSAAAANDDDDELASSPQAEWVLRGSRASERRPPTFRYGRVAAARRALASWRALDGSDLQWLPQHLSARLRLRFGSSCETLKLALLK